MDEPTITLQRTVIVAGSRRWTDAAYLRSVLTREHLREPIALIIEGGANGADRMGGIVADALGIKLHVERADWHAHGRAAGPIRNRAMLDLGPTEVIAFHEDIQHSKGTMDLLRQAVKRGIPISVYTADKTVWRPTVLP